MDMAGGSGSKRTSQGRRKIEIKKIEKRSSRQVTFSKRRTGLFKKASELCIITGAHAVILIWNEKHVFSFGHPTPDAVIDRYLSSAANGDVDGDGGTPAVVPVPNVGEYNEHYAEVSKELDLEKGKGVSGGGAAGEWWLDEVDGKGVEELEQYVAALEELSGKAARKADDLMVISSSSSFPAAAPPMTVDDPVAAFVNGLIKDN